jgi:hypothetical protein
MRRLDASNRMSNQSAEGSRSEKWTSIHFLKNTPEEAPKNGASKRPAVVSHSNALFSSVNADFLNSAGRTYIIDIHLGRLTPTPNFRIAAG